jgi:hypothetical protein
MPVKKLRSRNTANGSPNATWNSTTPAIVPNNPSEPNSFATGMSATWIGITSSPTTTTVSQSRPGKLIHARAYAASAEITTTSTVEGTAM